MRIVVIGGPRTGKTTIASELSSQLEIPRVWHTDDLIGKHGWSEVSRVASTWLDRDGPWIAEGVAMVRAIRKWLARHPEASALPFELREQWTPRVLLTPKQAIMTAGCRTVWVEVLNELIDRQARLPP